MNRRNYFIPGDPRKFTRLEVLGQYITAYLSASVIAMISYAVISGKLATLIFLPLIPLYFPRSAAFLFDLYQVNPRPIQVVIEYGSVLLTGLVGVLTRWRLGLLMFAAILVPNLGGCVKAGYLERLGPGRYSFHDPNPTANKAEHGER